MNQHWIFIEGFGQPELPGFYICYWEERDSNNGKITEMVHELCFTEQKEWISPFTKNQIKDVLFYCGLPLKPEKKKLILPADDIKLSGK